MFRFAFVTLAVLSSTAAGTQAATFIDPSFFGQAGTTTQAWQGFTSPAGPNPATTAANAAGTPNWFDRTAASDGAFNIGTAPTAHIYSFSGVLNPEIDVPTPTLAGAGLTQMVLQTEVSGSPLDAAQFLAKPLAGGAGVSPVSVAVTSTPSGNPMGGNVYDYTVTWSNVPANSGYAITYTPNATSSSQVAARVDTLSAVPEPAALAALCVVAGGLLRRRRGASNA